MSLRPRREVGFIVNPWAGAGGPAGLHGTDTPEQLAGARAAGHESRALARAGIVVSALRPHGRFLRIWTGSGALGQEALAGHLPDVQVLPLPATASGGEATRAAIAMMLGKGIELLMFAGGDGTARDVLAAARDRVPVLGIPAGTAMQSGVFAATPAAAGELAGAFLRGECRELREQDVQGRGGLAPGAVDMAPLVYGRLRVPYDREYMPGAKTVTMSPAAELAGLVRAVRDSLDDDRCMLFGPGSTKMAVLAQLGIEGCLPGVDVVQRGRLVARDAGETRLLEIVARHQARIVITPVGGQGFLFGRGNQPLSARVVRAVGVDNVTVVATPTKLRALGVKPLRVDFDDPELPRHFPLTLRVLTGPGQYQLHPLAPRI